MLNPSDVHAGLLLPGPLNADGTLDQNDHEILFNLCATMTNKENEGFVRRPALIFEREHAAIETAHHVIDAFCYFGCRVRYVAPEQSFWTPQTTERLITTMCRQKMFDADLWMFIGELPRLKNIVKAISPSCHGEFGAQNWKAFDEEAIIIIQASREYLLGTPATYVTQ